MKGRVVSWRQAGTDQQEKILQKGHISKTPKPKTSPGFNNEEVIRHFGRMTLGQLRVGGR